MKSPFIQLRILLKPWWAKLTAILLILLLITTWYATYIYLGWKAQANAISAAFEIQIEDFSPFNEDLTSLTKNDFFQSKNILPVWLTRIAPDIEMYGYRLTHAYIPASAGKFFNKIDQFPYIQSLHLEIYNPKEEKNITQALKNTDQFQTLTIDAFQFTSALAELITNNHNLQKLTLNCQDYPDNSIKQLTKLKHLKQLTIGSEVSFGRLSTTSLAHLSKIKSLQQLKVGTKTFNQQDAAALANLPNPKQLILKIYNPDNKGLLGLSQVKGLQGLQITIDLDFLNSNSPLNLSLMGSHENLTKLEIHHADHIGLDQLIKNTPNLEVLRLESIRHLDFLDHENSTNLKLIDLTINNPENKAPDYFKQLMNHNKLVRLKLSIVGTNLNDQAPSIQTYIEHLKLREPNVDINTDFNSEFSNFRIIIPDANMVKQPGYITAEREKLQAPIKEMNFDD